jgi:DNA (cytosine-5)-methyltransferase 1
MKKITQNIMVEYNCDKCNKKYTRKGDYNRHLNRKVSCVGKTLDERIKDTVAQKVKEEVEKLKIEITKELIPNTNACILMEQKNEEKECDICDGLYPVSKHNFDECYSLDFVWDLKQMGIKEYKFVDLFCGLGAFHNAFKKCETDFIKYKCVMACDIEESSQKIYYENYGVKPYGDINKINFNMVDDFDILCAGFPCQPFSNAGSKKGFDDIKKGNLFEKIMDIVDIKHPNMIILENVKNIVTINDGKVFETICTKIRERGYNISSKVLDSKNFGSPQSRQRVFLVCSRTDKYIFDFKSTGIVPVSTILDLTETAFIKYDHKYSLEKSESKHSMMLYKLINKKTKKGGRQGERVYSINTCGPTICASSGGPGGKTGLYYIDNKIRKLNVVECLQMFGYSKDFKRTTVPSDEKLLFHLGNSIVVDVVVSIIKRLHK